MKKLSETTKKLAIFTGLLLGAFAISAMANWSAPSFTPPDCPSTTPGCNEPVNIGSIGQIKTGNLGIGGLISIGGGGINTPVAGYVLTAIDSAGNAKWCPTTGCGALVVAPTLSVSPTSATAPATFTLSATAADSPTSVKFYNGASLINTDSASPYSYAWSGVGAGTYQLKAVATYPDSTTRDSNTVSVTSITGTQTTGTFNVSSWVAGEYTIDGVLYSPPIQFRTFTRNIGELETLTAKLVVYYNTDGNAATPNDPYRFDNWNGCVASATRGVCTYTTSATAGNISMAYSLYTGRSVPLTISKLNENHTIEIYNRTTNQTQSCPDGGSMTCQVNGLLRVGDVIAINGTSGVDNWTSSEITFDQPTTSCGKNNDRNGSQSCTFTVPPVDSAAISAIY